MVDESFQIANYYELRVTHKMMMAARFCPDPIDLEVPISPVAAGLHDRIMQQLMAIEIEKEGEEAKIRWGEWLEMSTDRREWDISVNRAKCDERWIDWSEMEQRFFTMTLLSPFKVSEGLIAEFVSEVQLYHAKLRDENKAA
jgi:hypothetical protein